jgi:hypothetical protein
MKRFLFLLFIFSVALSICPENTDLSSLEWTSILKGTGVTDATISKSIASQIKDTLWLLGDDGTENSGANVWTMMASMSFTQNITWQFFYNFYVYPNAFMIDS